MKNLLASVLPQDGGLEVATSRNYNLAIMVSGFLVAAGIAFGLHSFLVGHHVRREQVGVARIRVDDHLVNLLQTIRVAFHDRIIQ